ncbi:MAG TPA: hypothetical protein VFK69_02075 [Candidatus Eisenbacteria bacterium]|nr:hypothetical protein [Candidatus Eisenbacteria bacterium]
MSDERRRESQVLPFLVAALVCDVAATEPVSGKKSLIGIFDRVIAHKFPTARQLTVYGKIADAVGYYRVAVRFVQVKSGNVLAEASGTIMVQDRLSSTDFLVPFPMPLPLIEEGRYVFQVLMNDAVIGEAFIDATLVPDSTSQE